MSSSKKSGDDTSVFTSYAGTSKPDNPVRRKRYPNCYGLHREIPYNGHQLLLSSMLH